MNPPRTVRVRIAVAVNENGDWHCYPCHHEGDEVAATEAWANVGTTNAMTSCFIEADVPIPEETTVDGRVATLINCPHSGDGWCLQCVHELRARVAALEDGARKFLMLSPICRRNPKKCSRDSCFNRELCKAARAFKAILPDSQE